MTHLFSSTFVLIQCKPAKIYLNWFSCSHIIYFLIFPSNLRIRFFWRKKFGQDVEGFFDTHFTASFLSWNSEETDHEPLKKFEKKTIMVNVSATAAPRSYIAHVRPSNTNIKIYFYLSTIICDSGKLWQLWECKIQVEKLVQPWLQQTSHRA